jgi:hypothetical protein
MKHGSFPYVLSCVLVGAVDFALAQLPTTQLTSIFPPGGRPGATVEVTVAGSDIDDLETLIFNHSGFRVVNKRIAATELEPSRFVPNQFIVTIGGEMPPGIYEVRAAGRFGVSNPRSFAVGALGEVVESAGNSSPDKAVELSAATTYNGRVESSNYDFFRMNLKKGERVVVDVAAERIDSRLDGTLVLLDESGRELKRVKDGAGADPVLDFTAPADGSYLLKLADAVYGGGDGYFYRLTAHAGPIVDFVFPPSGPAGSHNQYTVYGRNLPGGVPIAGSSTGGAPLEKLPVIIPLPERTAHQGTFPFSGFAPLRSAWQDGIEFRLQSPTGPANAVPIYFAQSPTVVVEQEPNGEASSAQKIAVPCEYVGQFFPQRDIDWIQFDAKKGEAYWLEVISSQLGLESDPALAIYRVSKNKGGPQLSEIAQADDSQDRTRRIGADFDATSDDPAYRFRVPEDGTYAVMVRDQFGDSRSDPAYVYRLVIRSPRPDFRVLAYPSVPLPATPQTQNLSPLSSLCVRKGGTAAVAIVVQRRDDFDGEVAVTVEGLPPGVSCPGAVLGGSIDEGSLVFVANEDAAAWAGPIKILARAKIGEREVVREARYGSAVWGTTNRQQQPAEFRLSRSLALGVIDREAEPALVRVGEDKIWETSVGGSVEIPIQLTRRGDFKDPIKLVAVGLTQQMRPKDVTLSGDSSEGKFELQLNQQNVRPGTYTFYLRGETKRRYTRNPDAVAAAESEQKRIEEMIKRLQDELKSATEARDESAKRAAEEKLKEAGEIKERAERRASEVKQANQPKDVQFALVSTPIKLRIHSSPIKIDSVSLSGPIKQADKRDLLVKVERRFGFASDIELALEPPDGLKGLAAQKVTISKDKTEAKLEIACADEATPGQHACTLRAKGRFNNVQVESTATVTVVVDPK